MGNMGASLLKWLDVLDTMVGLWYPVDEADTADTEPPVADNTLFVDAVVAERASEFAEEEEIALEIL